MGQLMAREQQHRMQQQDGQHQQPEEGDGGADEGAGGRPPLADGGVAPDGAVLKRYPVDGGSHWYPFALFKIAARTAFT